MSLLELLQFMLGCQYLSDLHFYPYNIKAKILLEKINLNEYSEDEILDAFKYIYMDKKNKAR